MNLILFRREEIKSSARTGGNEDDDRDQVDDIDDHDSHDDDTDPASTTGTRKRRRPEGPQLAQQYKESKSGGVYNYLVRLRTDVIDIKKDSRIVHLKKHLKKMNVGDTFKVGILNGQQGHAMIIREKMESPDEFEEFSSFMFNFDPMKATTSSLSPLLLLSSSSSDPNSENQASNTGTTETEIGVTLLLSMPFPKRMKALWSQISSFGCVRRVCIVRGQLSDPDYIHSSAIKPQIYEPLILEGLAQGCHTRSVDVDVSSVNNVLDHQILDRVGVGNDNNGGNNNDLKLILDCGFEEDETTIENDGVSGSDGGGGETNARPVGLLNVLLTKARNSNIVIAIGSERGWTEDEARLFSR